MAKVTRTNTLDALLDDISRQLLAAETSPAPVRRVALRRLRSQTAPGRSPHGQPRRDYHLTELGRDLRSEFEPSALRRTWNYLTRHHPVTVEAIVRATSQNVKTVESHLWHFRQLGLIRSERIGRRGQRGRRGESRRVHRLAEVA